MNEWFWTFRATRPVFAVLFLVGIGMAARRRQQAEFRLERTVDVLQHLYEALYGASTGRER